MSLSPCLAGGIVPQHPEAARQEEDRERQLRVDARCGKHGEFFSDLMNEWCGQYTRAGECIYDRPFWFAMYRRTVAAETYPTEPM